MDWMTLLTMMCVGFGGFATGWAIRDDRTQLKSENAPGAIFFKARVVGHGSSWEGSDSVALSFEEVPHPNIERMLGKRIRVALIESVDIDTSDLRETPRSPGVRRG